MSDIDREIYRTLEACFLLNLPIEFCGDWGLIKYDLLSTLRRQLRRAEKGLEGYGDDQAPPEA